MIVQYMRVRERFPAVLATVRSTEEIGTVKHSLLDPHPTIARRETLPFPRVCTFVFYFATEITVRSPTELAIVWLLASMGTYVSP